MNHAVVLRLASEFQGFSRQLHTESLDFLKGRLLPGQPQFWTYLLVPYTKASILNTGNATAKALAEDFGLFGVLLWEKLRQTYPGQVDAWRRELNWLNKARNALAHEDYNQLVKLTADSVSIDDARARKWKTVLDELTEGIDRIVGDHFGIVFGVRPW
ncbi:hypothetical protein EV190_1145 [Actinorugispora endophytica]|uniref:RiboL-PSP-HEPN domain-containing protein n=1 Tax=Actinorugispora endophytica TaxID=1605990 RepID=A0A4R6US90_9ACTN|nr:hypothetical protein EV190_1145 [Actinorugispora endophytica]